MTPRFLTLTYRTAFPIAAPKSGRPFWLLMATRPMIGLYAAGPGIDAVVRTAC